MSNRHLPYVGCEGTSSPPFPLLRPSTFHIVQPRKVDVQILSHPIPGGSLKVSLAWADACSCGKSPTAGASCPCSASPPPTPAPRRGAMTSVAAWWWLTSLRGTSASSGNSTCSRRAGLPFPLLKVKHFLLYITYTVH